MCGIVGIVSACSNGFSSKEMAMFANLLFLDTTRGWDSTGVFGVHNNENVVLHKDAVHGLDFLRTKEYQSFKAEMISSGKVVVGHNRAATRGTVVDKNAHPFCIDDKVVLVQNGTYRGSHKHLKDTEVDTEAIAHVIAETPDVTEALKKINASYALVWYTVETKTLNIIRNSERPMFISTFHDKGIVFASEATMIKYAAEREEVKISEPVQLDAHTHVAITLDGKGGYTRVDTKLDIGNTFQSEDWENWQGYMVNRARRHHHQPTAVSSALTVAHSQGRRTHRFAGGRDDVKFPFIDALSSLDLDKFSFKSIEASTTDMDAVTAASFQGHHYIEMLDYLKANDHEDCMAWHVFGAVIGDNQGAEGGPCTLVHWIQYNKTEAEVFEMVYNMFYKVKLGSILMRRIRTANGEEVFLNTVYASTQEEIQGVPQQ